MISYLAFASDGAEQIPGRGYAGIDPVSGSSFFVSAKQCDGG